MTRFFCVFGLLSLACLSPAVAQNQPPFEVPRADTGTQLFRGLFDFHGITPESPANLKQGYDYKNLIVVVLGDPRNRNVVFAARDALANGGAVLIAADTALDLSPFLPQGGDVSITGRRVYYRKDPNANLMQWISRGYVEPVQPGLLDQARDGLQLAAPELELFKDIQRVEVDGPSYIANVSLPKELARNIAAFPKWAIYESKNEQKVSVTDKITFAAAGAGQANNPFRCVALADADLFSNRLIYGSARQVEPNDNLRFSNNLVQWLKGPEGRNKCLFIENGKPIDRFDEVKYSAIPLGPEMPPVPIPPIIDLLNRLFQRDVEAQQYVTDLGNRVVEKAEDEDVLNKLIADTNDKKATVYRALAVIAAIVAYCLLRSRTLGQKFQALFRPIPKDPHRLGPDTAIGSLEHRRLELLRGGDYGGPVRSYVRQLFEERGLPRGYDDDRLPPVEFDVRNPDFLRKSVRTLWAEVRSRKPVNYSRWKELEPMLAAVRAAADDDRWWFVPDEGTA